MQSSGVNRRRHERYALAPMYTPITVRVRGDGANLYEGHTYDISEGGLQFELDEPIAPGTPVILQVTLPAGTWENCDDLGPGRTILAEGNVVWSDTTEPGPVRTAVVFTRFAKLTDKERLMRQISGGKLRRAA